MSIANNLNNNKQYIKIRKGTRKRINKKKTHDEKHDDWEHIKHVQYTIHVCVSKAVNGYI